jgi:uncharacterized membrane protein
MTDRDAGRWGSRVPSVLRLLGLLVVGVVAVLAGIEVESPLRVAVTLVFVLLVPGYAVVGHLRLADPVSTLMLSITVSLALGALVAQLLVWQESYSAERAFAWLAAISLIGLVTQLAGAPKEQGAAPAVGSASRDRAG